MRVATSSLLGALQLVSLLAFLMAPSLVNAQITPLSVPELPESIPLFPLPNVAVLPFHQLPLHVFEPRYRQMIADALAGDHVIGIVQLQPGFEADYQGRPPIFSIGCAAIIVSSEPTGGGEFDIVLRGFSKFRVTSETARGPYRLARVERIAEPTDQPMLATLREERPALETALATSLGVSRDALRLPSMSDDDLVNLLVMSLDFDTVDRQLLLEQVGVLARARKLVEFLNRPIVDLPSSRRP